jgi:hypothetical protein
MDQVDSMTLGAVLGSLPRLSAVQQHCLNSCCSSQYMGVLWVMAILFELV